MDQKTAGMGKPQITPELLRQSQNVVCECGGMIFQEKLFFKKISAILSPNGREEIAPMPIIVCEDCGKVPSTFDTQNVLPKEIKADGKKRSLVGDLVVDGYIYSTKDVRVGLPEEWAEGGPYAGSNPDLQKKKK